MKNLTNADREFLQAVGIAVETEPDPRLALAQRIARHRAPIEVPVEPARLHSVFSTLLVERLLETVHALTPVEQDELRREIYERMTGKSYRPHRESP